MCASSRNCSTAVLCLFVYLSVTAACVAQNARFTGQVTDPQNAAVGRASIEITNQDTGVQLHTESDDSGTYSIPYLTAGRYRIVIQAPGFNMSVHDVALGMGQTLIFNAQLSLGEAQATTINVQSGSELTELHLETASNT